MTWHRNQIGVVPIRNVSRKLGAGREKRSRGNRQPVAEFRKQFE